MDKNREQLRRPMYLVNTLLLMTHILLLLFFVLTHITLMAAVNIFSMATYIVLYVAIKNDRSRVYIISTTMEIIVHMVLAVVCGVERLHGADVLSADLRGGAALVIAALQAEGQSSIHRTHHIQRGYADLTGDLARLGARIRADGK